MSKPAHRGRILVSSSRLEPLSSGGNQPVQPPASKVMTGRRGSGSKSADNMKKGSLVASGTSALAGMSKDKLLHRLQELEFDNQKLQSNLQKAEISIEGYRGFLSDKSAKRAHNIAIQTDFLAESNSTSKITPKKTQVSKLTKKLDEANTKIQQLTQELADLAEHDKEKENNINFKNLYTSLKMNTDLAEVSYKAQIVTLEKDLRLALDRAHNPSTPNTKTNARHESTQKSKALTQTPKKTPTVELSSRPPSSAKKHPRVPSTPPSTSERLHFQPSPSPATEFLSIVSPAPTVINKLKVLSPTNKRPSSSSERVKPNTSLAKPLHELKKKVTSCKYQIETNKRTAQQEFNDYSDLLAQGSARIIREINGYNGHRDRQLSRQANTIASLRNDLAQTSNHEDSEKAAADAMAALEKKYVTAMSALDLELAAAKEATDRERQRADSLTVEFEAKIKERDWDHSNLLTLFTSVSRELQNLQAKFKSEAAAVKHIGHCKDLVRVATIRELTLDYDRAVSELKYSRDLQSVLSFCLETAEKTLFETQPQVVMKLQESRHKRSTLLEREVTVRRKDLDQRSAETCAVSSTHLEAFQEKSVIKHKKAAEETESLFTEIQNILNIKRKT